MIGYLLILLGLVSAIAGTLSEANKTIKSVIIGIATLSAAASGLLYFQNDQEAQLNKRLIASLVQATQDERHFAETIRIAANQSLTPKGLNLSGLGFSTHGLIMTVSTKQDETFAGAVFLDQKDLRDVRYALIAETGLPDILAHHMFTDIWTQQDLDQSWNTLVVKLARLAIHSAQEVSLYDGDFEVDFPGGNSIRLYDARTQGGLLRLTISSAQIQALAGLSPLERGMAISATITEQVIANL